MTGALVLSALSGCAQWQGDFSPSVYLAGGLGVSKLSPDADGTELNVTKNSAMSFWSGVGVDVTERLSVELQYADLGQVKLQPGSETIDYTAKGLSGILYGLADPENLVARRGLAGFARLGLTKMDYEASIRLDADNSAQLWFGAGAEYMMDSGLAGRVEFSSYDGDAQALLISMLYRFGAAKRSAEREIDAPIKPSINSSQPVPASKPEITPEPKVQAPSASSELPQPELAPQNTNTIKPDQEIQQPKSDETQPTIIAPEPSVEEPIIAAKPAPLPETVTLPAPETLTPTPAVAPLIAGIQPGLQFFSGTTELTPSGKAAARQLADTLRSRPTSKIELRAYTDSILEPAAAMRLTRQRVVRVARALISAGVDKGQLAARAFGSSAPITPNSSPEGRKRNNRISIDILTP